MLNILPFANSFDPKLSRKHSNANAVQMVLGLPPKIDLGGKTVKFYLLSRLVQDTVYNFCNSTDISISAQHVPKQVVSPQTLEMIQRWSGAYWDFLISNKEHQDHIVKFHHLMKYWAMRPDIQLPEHYSNIIVDEAQDTNGAFYQVLQNHIDRNFVVIGDRHQQLYKWRGAINTMNMFELPSKSLTMSRRFGDSIAQCANRVLEKHSVPPQDLIGGHNAINSKVIFYHPNEIFPGKTGAILTRTRTEVIAIAKNELELGNPISVKTEFNSTRYLCSNIIALAKNDRERITHPYVSKCYSLSNLETELENAPDGDIYFAFKLFRKYGEDVLRVIDHVEQMNQP